MSSTPLSGTIILSSQEPLAGGLTQFVYQHPHDSGLLIKVRRVDKLQRTYDLKIGGRVGFRRRYGVYTTWMRELREYLAARVRAGRHPEFLQRYIGLVETDIGLGLAVGKVTDRSGALARTLEETIWDIGFTPHLRAQLDDLFRKVTELEVATNDISPRNIVCAWAESLGDHLVMIEGIGVKTFIPVASFGRLANSYTNNRHFARTLRSCAKHQRRYLQNHPQ